MQESETTNITTATTKQRNIPTKKFHLALQRRSFILLAIFAFCFLAFFVSLSNHNLVPHVSSLFGYYSLSFFKPGYLVDTPGCEMPDFDPFHPSIAKFIKPRFVTCPGKKTFLQVSSNATLRLDSKQLMSVHGTKPDDLSCTYRPILRNAQKDGFSYGKMSKLKFDIPLGLDAVHVKCFTKMKFLSEDYFPLIAFKNDLERRCDLAVQTDERNENRLNVIILGVDSISKLSFLRYFKKTRHYLQNVLGAIELKGYNKVGDNTYPNLVALLSGHLVNAEFNAKYGKPNYDHLDLIWKRYAEHGYRTLMAEDAPSISLFNYHRNGFFKQPSDYYLRPFAAAVENSKWRRRSTKFCFQSKLEIRVLYDYLLNFLETMDHRSLFAFAFAARLTHDDGNLAATADQPVFETLTKISDLGYINNSLLIFMSDHGLRFGSVRKTFVGRFEEHWPVMFMSFPKWFYEKFPKHYQNLLKNQRRLTTPLDIHQTLKHLISMIEYNGTYTDPQSGFGMSLFKEVPPERTCKDAGIDDHWCTCQSLVPADVLSPQVQKAAVTIVTTINDWLSNERDSCADLILKEVVSCHMTRSIEEALMGKDSIKKTVFKGENNVQTDYLVVVEVLPSNAVFEATVRYSNIQKTFKVLGDVSRINAYGEQSSCVFDAWLKKFCFCKTVLKSR